jgi:hypothetical protein
MTPLGTAALTLAGKGFRVFPCVERGKEPAIHDNLKRATTDANTISGWWRSRNFNIGLATGAESGVWVADIDGDQGRETLATLEEQHGALPPTVEAITATAGISISAGQPPVREYATSRTTRSCRASMCAAQAAV